MPWRRWHRCVAGLLGTAALGGRGLGEASADQAGACPSRGAATHDAASLLQLPRRAPGAPPVGQVECDLEVFDQKLHRLLGGANAAACRVLAERDYKFAHEAPVYLASLHSVLFSSNRLGEGAHQVIELATVHMETGQVDRLPDDVWRNRVLMANGGTNDAGCESHGDSVLLAAQGQMNSTSGVFRMRAGSWTVEPVLTSTFWEANAQFNSPNDLVIDPVSGALLLTDPVYGYLQNFRPRPVLGNWLWVYPPGAKAGQQQTQRLRVLDDTFSRPNGLAFNPQADRLYVSDSGYFPGADFVSDIDITRWLKNESDLLLNNTLATGPRSVYVFDVVRDGRGDITELRNRRVFLTASSGVPDGIKVDCEGNVYVGVANGVGMYDQHGTWLGTVKTRDGCANLVLVPRGWQTELVAMCETQIYTVMLRTRSDCWARRH